MISSRFMQRKDGDDGSHPGGQSGDLESPYLDGELFTAETRPGWGANLAALEAESPYLGAFEPGQPGVYQAEEGEQELFWGEFDPDLAGELEDYAGEEEDEGTTSFENDSPTGGSPTIPDSLLSVQPFSTSQRTTIGPLLKPAEIKAAIRWNTERHPKISGLVPADLLNALQNYVDPAAIQKAIADYNTKNPGAPISPGTPPIDAVFVETVHQFQLKCYQNPKQHDGLAGATILDSLGFWPRKGLLSKADTNEWAKKLVRSRKKKIDEALAAGPVDLAKDLKASNWWDSFVNPCFLGWEFALPIHVYLARKLRKVEQALLSQARFTDRTPVELAALLDIQEKHAGGRSNSDSKSVHTLGLAVDIKYTGNPHVGDFRDKPNGAKFFSKVMKRATAKISGFTLSEATFPEYLNKLGIDESKSTSQVYDELFQRDQDLRQYLALPGSRSDLSQLRNGVFKGRVARDPRNGFLNLDKDLVNTLRDTACLVWGAVDFGSNACGDMMHFDCRLDGLGIAVYCNTGGTFNEKHPCWRRPDLPCAEAKAKSGAGKSSTAGELFFSQSKDKDLSEAGEYAEERFGEPTTGLANEFSEEMAETLEASELYGFEPEENQEQLFEEQVPNRVNADPPGLTVYVDIDLGKDIRCLKSENSNCKKWSDPFQIKRETGIFIPENYSTQKQGNNVDIILYFHGHKNEIPGGDAFISEYWNGAHYPAFGLREVINASKKNVILVAPTLGLLAEPGNLVKGKGLDTFLDQVLEALKSYGPYKGKSITIGHLILAAHSGAGKHMATLALSSSAYLANIQECWGLDSLYNSKDIKKWIDWAQNHTGSRFYSYYSKGDPNKPRLPRDNSKSLKQKITQTKPKVQNIEVLETTSGHFTLVREKLKERLDAASYLQNTNGSSPELPEDFAAEEADELEHEYAEFEGEDEEYEGAELEDESLNLYPLEYEDSDSLFEAFAPKVSQSDLRKRIDEYFDKANAEYNLGGGVIVKARPQFRYAKSFSPEKTKEEVSGVLGKDFEKAHPRAIHNAAYGRAKPGEIAAITQALIDKGELTAVRDAFSGLPDDQLVRKLMRKFRIGIDCAGYVQLAFFFAFMGNDNDTSTLRKSLGLNVKRGSEKLAWLPSTHFATVKLDDARTGDLFVFYPRLDPSMAPDCAAAIKKFTKGDSSGFFDPDWHTVIVVSHTTSGSQHTFLVDASWGTDTYGDKYSGVARRELVFDATTKEWWDVSPGKVELSDTLRGVEFDAGDKAFINKIGPYDGHCIKGVYRAKQKG